MIKLKHLNWQTSWASLFWVISLEAEKNAVIQKITETLSALAANNISHGDLKHSNILVLDSRPVLTDLDAMQVNRIKWLAQYRAARDMEKFINGARGNYDITNFLQKNAGQLTK